MPELKHSKWRKILCTPFKFWPHFISMCCHARLPAPLIHYQFLWQACGIIMYSNPLFHSYIYRLNKFALVRALGNENMQMSLKHSFTHKGDNNLFCLCNWFELIKMSYNESYTCLAIGGEPSCMAETRLASPEENISACQAAKYVLGKLIF